MEFFKEIKGKRKTLIVIFLDCIQEKEWEVGGKVGKCRNWPWVKLPSQWLEAWSDCDGCFPQLLVQLYLGIIPGVNWGEEPIQVGNFKISELGLRLLSSPQRPQINCIKI